MKETQYNIYMTREIPGNLAEDLKQAGHEVTVGPSYRPPTRKELMRALKKKPYDILVTLLTDEIDADMMDSVPNVKLIANYAVGYNNIDIAEAEKRGVIVTNTPGNMSHTVAEHTIALLLALTSNVVQGDKFVRAGKYRGWDPTLFNGTDLRGKTLALVGAGSIGEATARIAHAGFGMKIVYTDIKENTTLESDCDAEYRASLDELLSEADVVSIHVPLLPETTHLMTAERFKLMKPTAYLINTARGAIVDEKALIVALKEGQLAGAGLDVFEDEPKLARGLTRLPNVVLTPHIGSATKEARQEMTARLLKNVMSFCKDGKAPDAVTS